MANQKAHGQDRPVEVAFDTADATVTFTPGDLVYLNSSNYAQPMGGSTVTTAFLGIAAQKKAAGTTGTAKRLFGNNTDGIIRVDTDGVYDLDRSDTVALVMGDFIGPSGTGSQTVKKVAGETISIGRCVKAVAAGATRCRVKIQSAVVPAAKTT